MLPTTSQKKWEKTYTSIELLETIGTPGDKSQITYDGEQQRKLYQYSTYGSGDENTYLQEQLASALVTILTKIQQAFNYNKCTQDVDALACVCFCMGSLEGALKQLCSEETRSRSYATRAAQTAMLDTEKEQELLVQFFKDHNPGKQSNLDLARKIIGSFARLSEFKAFTISEKTVLNKLTKLDLLGSSERDESENA